jgi:very-short-patch-repair endonuclease
MRDDPPLPLVFHRRHALAAGLTPDQVTHRLATARWHRLRRGVYCTCAVWNDASPERRTALLGMAAVLLRCSDTPFVLSHATAAAMYDLPIPRDGTTWITVAAGHGAGTHYDRALRQEVATLPTEHVRRLHGWPITTPARTVADCLRHLRAEDAVAMADAALHRRLLLPEALIAVVRWQESWPLAAAARSALDVVDGRRESPLESRSAVVMQRHGVPAPLCQAEVRDQRGAFVARVDFAWPDVAVVGEADGRSKYEGDAVRAFEAEKDRQAALEGLGLIVVRWGSRHLEGPRPQIISRIREAMTRSPRPRFTGSLAPALWQYTG